jgi:hypothetical protein
MGKTSVGVALQLMRPAGEAWRAEGQQWQDAMLDPSSDAGARQLAARRRCQHAGPAPAAGLGWAAAARGRYGEAGKLPIPPASPAARRRRRQPQARRLPRHRALLRAGPVARRDRQGLRAGPPAERARLRSRCQQPADAHASCPARLALAASRTGRIPAPPCTTGCAQLACCRRRPRPPRRCACTTAAGGPATPRASQSTTWCSPRPGWPGTRAVGGGQRDLLPAVRGRCWLPSRACQYTGL